MDIKPEFKKGEGADEVCIDGTEIYIITDLHDSVQPLQNLDVVAFKKYGTQHTFSTPVRIDTPVEVDCYRNGGILQHVVRSLAKLQLVAPPFFKTPYDSFVFRMSVFR